jgi:type IV pilus assembly protein PilC
MPSFEYSVRDKRGQALKGYMDAPGIREAAMKLREEGYYITSLQPKGETKAGAEKQTKIFQKKVNLRELLIFTRQFGVMIRAGVNLASCLNLMTQQTENSYFASVIHQIRRNVEGGETLHGAMAKYPKIFPTIYIHMVEAGEASGQLETVLFRLVEHLEREFELKKKVTGAMTYPAVVVTVAIGVIFGLMTFVLPNFLGMFREANMKLPSVTLLLMATSDMFVKYWYLILAALVGTVVGVKVYYDTSDGRRKIDKLLFNLKIIGPVIQKLASARFSRTLATLLESGLMITLSLEMVERAVGNTVIADAIGQARVNITQGTGLAKPLIEKKVFPPMVTQMIAVGEETGELSTMLNQVADFYEREAGYAIESLTTLIEPAIMVCLGGVVALVVAAVMIPMFSLSSGATLK